MPKKVKITKRNARHRLASVPRRAMGVAQRYRREMKAREGTRKTKRLREAIAGKHREGYTRKKRG